MRDAVVSKASTLSKLVKKKHPVSISNGQLVIKPTNGNLVPTDWLAHHSAAVIEEIAILTDRSCFKYQGYKLVKNYHPKISVRLEFTSLITGKSIPMFFEVHTTRLKSTRLGKQGDQLPNGKWRLPDKSGLKILWPFPKPRRDSEYSEKMWQFQSLVFAGEINSRNKLSKESFRPLNITSAEICSAYHRQVAGKRSASDRQESRQENPQTTISKGSNANPTTCENKELKSKQVKESMSNPSSPSTYSITELVRNQSKVEWDKGLNSKPH
jgi:hypothetical protein